MNVRVRVFIALVVTSLITGCGSARRSEPVVGPIEHSPAGQRGEVVFMKHCNNCHPQGDSGVGPAINNKPIPKSILHLQVRKGFGTMPAFGADKISDPDLDALSTYLVELRRAK